MKFMAFSIFSFSLSVVRWYYLHSIVGKWQITEKEKRKNTIEMINYDCVNVQCRMENLFRCKIFSISFEFIRELKMQSVIKSSQTTRDEQAKEQKWKTEKTTIERKKKTQQIYFWAKCFLSAEMTNWCVRALVTWSSQLQLFFALFIIFIACNRCKSVCNVSKKKCSHGRKRKIAFFTNRDDRDDEKTLYKLLDVMK